MLENNLFVYTDMEGAQTSPNSQFNKASIIIQADSYIQREDKLFYSKEANKAMKIGRTV